MKKEKKEKKITEKQKVTKHGMKCTNFDEQNNFDSAFPTTTANNFHKEKDHNHVVTENKNSKHKTMSYLRDLFNNDFIEDNQRVIENLGYQKNKW